MESITQLLTQRSVIFDLALVAIILFFAVLGARRGLVLSLCSLVAVILALIGGTLVADALTPPLSAQAAPILEGFVQEHLDDLSTYGVEALETMDGFLPHIARNVLESREWALQTEAFLSEFALAMTQAILHPILFLIAFIVVLILWYFISHGLDLVAHLPVLSALNAVGGFLFGAVKGVLILVVVYLVVKTFRPDLIPADILAGSRILGVLQKAPALF